MLQLVSKVRWLQEGSFDTYIRTAHHLLAPPISNTRAASNYHSVVPVRRATRKNNYRPMTEGTHFARAERKLTDEFFESYFQLNLSGDDMNIIQVGRPAVSRYHQIRGFFPEGFSPNLPVHDFPNAEYGIKLGGFMIRGGWSKHQKKAFELEDLHPDVYKTLNFWLREKGLRVLDE